MDSRRYLYDLVRDRQHHDFFPGSVAPVRMLGRWTNELKFLLELVWKGLVRIYDRRTWPNTPCHITDLFMLVQSQQLTHMEMHRYLVDHDHVLLVDTRTADVEQRIRDANEDGYVLDLPIYTTHGHEPDVAPQPKTHVRFLTTDDRHVYVPLKFDQHVAWTMDDLYAGTLEMRLNSTRRQFYDHPDEDYEIVFVDREPHSGPDTIPFEDLPV